MPKPGTLFVVATPIGNLEDITLRALRILKEVKCIAAEDTRVTRKLLSHYDIHTPLISCHQNVREARLRELVGELVAGSDVALVSDAGLPAVSDPGADLVRLAINAGVTVSPIPGANAALSALVVSGLPSGRFTFEGFPPRGKSDRREFFRSLKAERRTILLYESPNRAVDTLEDIYREMGERRVVIGRELTKMFEEVYRGSLSEAITHFSEKRPKGEFTIVVEGAGEPLVDSVAEAQGLDQMLKAKRDAGLSGRDAVQSTAKELGLPRKVVYAAWLELTDH
ncbi:MAG: 16S rRNA (cytidine(1402)-2'-O)-methyltransferase [Chthonomonadales bacterium]